MNDLELTVSTLTLILRRYLILNIVRNLKLIHFRQQLECI